MSDLKEFEITTRVVESKAPGMPVWKLHFKFEDCCATVSDDDGNKIGSIDGCIGSGVEIVVGEYVYYLTPQALWESVYTMHENRKLPG